MLFKTQIDCHLVFGCLHVETNLLEFSADQLKICMIQKLPIFTEDMLEEREQTLTTLQDLVCFKLAKVHKKSHPFF